MAIAKGKGQLGKVEKKKKTGNYIKVTYVTSRKGIENLNVDANDSVGL